MTSTKSYRVHHQRPTIVLIFQRIHEHVELCLASMKGQEKMNTLTKMKIGIGFVDVERIAF